MSLWERVVISRITLLRGGTRDTEAETTPVEARNVDPHVNPTPHYLLAARAIR